MDKPNFILSPYIFTPNVYYVTDEQLLRGALIAIRDFPEATLHQGSGVNFNTLLYEGFRKFVAAEVLSQVSNNPKESLLKRNNHKSVKEHVKAEAALWVRLWYCLLDLHSYSPYLEQPALIFTYIIAESTLVFLGSEHVDNRPLAKV